MFLQLARRSMTQATTLDYANPQRRIPTPHLSLVLALALAAAFLEANAFADAVGIAPVIDVERDPGHVFLRIICGVIVGFVALAILLFLVRGGQWLIHALGATQAKPSSSVAITCIVTGAVCLLGALAIPLLFVHGATIQVSNGQATLMANTPMLEELLAALTFIAGAFLVGFGIWGGVARTP